MFDLVLEPFHDFKIFSYIYISIYIYIYFAKTEISVLISYPSHIQGMIGFRTSTTRRCIWFPNVMVAGLWGHTRSNLCKECPTVWNPFSASAAMTIQPYSSTPWSSTRRVMFVPRTGFREWKPQQLEQKIPKAPPQGVPEADQGSAGRSSFELFGCSPL